MTVAHNTYSNWKYKQVDL